MGGMFIVMGNNKIGIGINVKLINGSLKSLKNVLNNVNKAGFKVVELPLHGLDVIFGKNIRKNRVKEIKNILNDYPFVYTVHCAESLNLMNLKDIETEKAILELSIEFLYQINSHIMVYHPGRFKSETEILMRKKKKTSQSEQDKLKKIERDILRGFSLMLKHADVVLCMENARPFIDEKGYTYAEDIGELVKQVEKINDNNIGINLDFGHAYLSANFYNKDFLKIIYKVKPYLRHLHFHDNFGLPCYFYEKDQNLLIANARGDMHLPPGWGNIPFKEAVEVLNPKDCSFMIELRSRYFEYIKESKEMMEGLIL